MSDGPSRRQSRGKRPQSYRFEDEYSFLDEDQSQHSETQSPDLQDESQDDGDDFVPDGQEEEEEPEDDLDEGVVESEEEGEQEDDSEEELHRPARPNHRALSLVELDIADEPSEPIKNITRKTVETKTPIRFAKGCGVKVHKVANDKLRTRGVADFTKVGGQEIRLKDLFGPRNDDLKPIMTTRDYWLKQETLPLRQSGGMRRSFFVAEGAREKEVASIRTWYTDSGKDAFVKVQRSKRLTAHEGQAYMGTSKTEGLNVLLGSSNNLQLHTLEKGSCLKVAESFEYDRQERRGWVLNLGSKIREAQWATNEERNTQYLAIVVEQHAKDARSPKLMENPTAPAFTPTKPYAASIQIWAFEALDTGELDTSKHPRREAVICTDWGAPTFFRWCPIEATDRSQQLEGDKSVHLGLLAGIWSDGRVRILDVTIPGHDVEHEDTMFLHFSRAAFDVSFPNTVPTSLHWLSPTSLAVATSAGTVAIWTLSRPGTLAVTESGIHTPRPWFYQQLADTFILTISSGWPSQPQLLSVSIADGFSRMYDLRSPAFDSIASMRGRTLCTTQAWHEHTQCFVMPDEYFMLKHSPIRRYYHNLYSMRSQSTITRVATSPVHPGLLVGESNGTVETSNPVGRIANYKIIPWQQKWFVHEWRGPVEKLIIEAPSEDVEMVDREQVGDPTSSSSDTNDEDEDAPRLTPAKVSPSILSQPLIRFTEGYKAVQPGIQHSTRSKKPSKVEKGRGITVYEEESGVTALAWNPNLKYGTWAVAGMGSGLLRVEDIGV